MDSRGGWIGCIFVIMEALSEGLKGGIEVLYLAYPVYSRSGL